MITCPFCGSENDRSQAITVQPGLLIAPRMKPGDISMCVECGGVSLVADDKTLRKPTADEQDNPAFELLRETWQRIKGKAQ